MGQTSSRVTPDIQFNTQHRPRTHQVQATSHHIVSESENPVSERDQYVPIQVDTTTNEVDHCVICCSTV